MLDSVLAARDKFLKPGGAVLPDTATILVAGASAAALGLDFWDDVYGFSMLPVRRDLEFSGEHPVGGGASGRRVVRGPNHARAFLFCGTWNEVVVCAREAAGSCLLLARPVSPLVRAGILAVACSGTQTVPASTRGAWSLARAWPRPTPPRPCIPPFLALQHTERPWCRW